MTKAAIKPDRRSTALFVCDIQERFRTAIYEFESMVSTARKLVEAAKLLKLPVYATEQNPRALGATVDELKLAELPSDLHPLGKTLPKTLFSMCIPELKKSLHEKQIRNVVIVGIESHVCVLQTAFDLIQDGIAVHVVADGVSSCNAQEIPLALERMRSAGAHITTSESIIFQLMDDASIPEFKAVSKLIKEEKEATKRNISLLPPMARL